MSVKKIGFVVVLCSIVCINVIGRGYIKPSFEDIEKVYEAVMAHKKAGKTFALEVRKTPSDIRLEWSIVDVQPYRPLGRAPTDAFCDIINKNAQARMVFADDKYIGIFSLSHPSPDYTRIMIVPRTHVCNVTEVSKEAFKMILKKGAESAAELGSSDSYTLRTNHGSPLQGVPHLHLHVYAYHGKRSRNIFDLVASRRWNGKVFNDSAKLVAQAK
jgi:diadenosine tetraphosphate (Ap4A) HIT family hydrolase